MRFGSRDLLKCFLFLILPYCNASSSNIFSSFTISSLIVTCTINHQVPSAIAFPFDFIFKGRKDINEFKRLPGPPAPPRPQPTSKPPRYYELATKLLDWAFNELDESDEETWKPSSPRFDVDKMASSSEEEEAETQELKDKSKELQKMTREIKDLRKRRVESSPGRKKKSKKSRSRSGSTSKKSKKSKKSIRSPPPTSVEYDGTIEKASVQELKQLLKQMKREEEGIFGSNIFTNPVTTSILSFGTNVFKTMYCGWSSKSSYCSPDRKHSGDGGGGPSSIFDGVGRALAILTKS